MLWEETQITTKRWKGVLCDSRVLPTWRKYAQDANERIHAFIEFDPERALEDSQPDGPFWGLPFAVKDNIAVERFRLTCGSKILGSVYAPHTATAVRRLQQAGAVVVGKTNLDEFGMGSSTENSAFCRTHNPWDLARVPGGSSGGSAAAVAAGIVPFALGSDTGGSVRQPASFCGIFGLKPTYGAVSRFGLVAYASSLEVIGVLAKRVSMLADVFESMQGEDPRDQSSLASTGGRKMPDGKMPAELSIGIPREIMNLSIHPDVQASLNVTRRRLTELGHKVIDVELPTLDYVVAAYYVIATAEASSNLARFDGVRYGRRAEAENPEELMLRSRTEGFGEETKLRVLLGTYVLRSGFYDQYYLRAQRIRTAIRNDFGKAFESASLILMPVYPIPPFEFGSAAVDPFTQKLSDVFTCTANLAGLPALSFPSSVENSLPIGMQLLAPPFCEQLLFRTCLALERISPAPDPPGFQNWEDE